MREDAREYCGLRSRFVLAELREARATLPCFSIISRTTSFGYGTARWKFCNVESIVFLGRAQRRCRQRDVDRSARGAHLSIDAHSESFSLTPAPDNLRAREAS